MQSAEFRRIEFSPQDEQPFTETCAEGTPLRVQAVAVHLTATNERRPSDQRQQEQFFVVKAHRCDGRFSRNKASKRRLL
jgi:hypothetical protein